MENLVIFYSFSQFFLEILEIQPHLEQGESGNGSTDYVARNGHIQGGYEAHGPIFFFIVLSFLSSLT